MGRKHIGITARKNGLQMSFTYRGKRVREHFSVEPNRQNMQAVARRREAVLLDIELNRFDYFKHFPSGKNAHIFDQGGASKILFADAANEWLKIHKTRIEYSTLKGYASVVRYHLVPQFGGFSITDISTKIIRNWMANLEVSPKRVNNILIPLRMILEVAYQDEIIDSNPTHRIKNLPLETREPEPFSKKEIEEILTIMDGLGKNLIEFAFHSGLRTSELIGLKWTNVDFANNRIYVREAIVGNKTKQPKTTSGSRTVFLNERSRNALVRHKKLSTTAYGLVFYDDRNPGESLNDQKIRKRYWTPALKAAGIKYRPPYQTRHTFASQMLQAGKKPSWVSNQLGHATSAVTFARYARWIPDND